MCESTGGYECKEPDPGKFTLAFWSLGDAVAFGARAQADARVGRCGLTPG